MAHAWVKARFEQSKIWVVARKNNRWVRETGQLG